MKSSLEKAFTGDFLSKISKRGDIQFQNPSHDQLKTHFHKGVKERRIDYARQDEAFLFKITVRLQCNPILFYGGRERKKLLINSRFSGWISSYLWAYPGPHLLGLRSRRDIISLITCYADQLHFIRPSVINLVPVMGSTGGITFILPHLEKSSRCGLV